MKKDWFSTLIILLLILALNSFSEAYGQSARGILEQTDVKGGLIVHIDCGDGRLTAALRDNERYIVHGLDTDTKDIEAARRYIQSLGLYGPVSVQSWNGGALPYADNLASLVVADEPNRVSMNEVMRVLRPLGVAYVKSGDDVATWLDDGQKVVQLDGVVSDADAGPPPATLEWTVIAEPNELKPAQISDPLVPSPSVTVKELGSYTLQLEARDGEFTVTDTMQIVLYADSCEHAQNQDGFGWLVGDVNHDCKVDFLDVANLGTSWLEENYSTE